MNQFYITYSPEFETIIPHDDLKSADSDAKGLSEKHPGKEFFVCKAMWSYKSDASMEIGICHMIDEKDELLMD